MALDFVVYGFILLIICILIASKVCPNGTWDCPYGGPANDSAKWFYYLSKLCFPGAFEITDLHPTSSNGDLDVTIDERDGNQQNYTIPYSTVPILQREGRFKFDLTAGDFRSGNSQQSSPFFFRVRHSAVYHRNLLPTAGRNYLPITPPFIRAGAQSRELGRSVAGCNACAQSVSRRQSS